MTDRHVSPRAVAVRRSLPAESGRAGVRCCVSYGVTFPVVPDRSALAVASVGIPFCVARASCSVPRFV